MTGAGGLSSGLKPSRKPCPHSNSRRGVAGQPAPQKGEAETKDSDPGEGFPHRQHHLEIALMPLPTIILVSFRPLGPSRNFLWSDLPAQAGNDDPPLVIAQG